MNKNENVVIFDFDGVIIDSLQHAYQVWIDAGATFSLAEYVSHFEGNIYDSPKLASLNFAERFQKKVKRINTFPGITDVIAELSNDYRLYIVSSNLNSFIEEVLARHSMQDQFQQVLGGDIAHSKVEKINMILENHSLKPQESVMITDTLGDLREANQVSLPTIAVTWGFHTRKKLEEGNPRAIVEQPNGIPRTVKEILQSS